MTVLSKGIIEKSLVFFALLPLVFGCKVIQYVPVKETEYVTVKDTTYLHKTDTLVQVPEFHLSDYAGLCDTLVLKASNSEATAWVDSTAMVLKGRLVQTGKIPVQIVEKERVVYKDSVVTKEVPVPVEVVKTVHPKYEKWLWFWLVASVLVLGFWIYGKIKLNL